MPVTGRLKHMKDIEFLGMTLDKWGGSLLLAALVVVVVLVLVGRLRGPS